MVGQAVAGRSGNAKARGHCRRSSNAGHLDLELAKVATSPLLRRNSWGAHHSHHLGDYWYSVFHPWGTWVPASTEWELEGGGDGEKAGSG